MADKESFLSKAMADGKVIAKTMTLMTKLGKLQLEVRKKHQQKERLIRAVGAKIVELYEDTGEIDADAIFKEVRGDLQEAQDCERDVEKLRVEMDQVKADFRATAGKEPPEEPPEEPEQPQKK